MPNQRATRKNQIFVVIVLFVLVSSGCLSSTNQGSKSSDSKLIVPEWNIGDWWMYTFTTPEFGDVTTRLVVTETEADSNSSYMLGITNQLESHRHALLNFNPFLGRITHSNLSVYENGIPQPVFSFPLEEGNSWTFDLFGFSEWNANVLLISGGVSYITAVHSEGGTLEYEYDNSLRFLSKFVWTNSDNVIKMEMRWSGEKGVDYEGDAFFVRAFDFKNEIYEGNDGETYDSTFLNNGHPTDGNFDHLYIYLDVEIAGSAASHGSFSIKDHRGISPKVETWNAGTSEKGSISVIPSQSGEYSLTVTCTGANSIIHVIVVGGLERSWNL
ncbi:MAG: hypothetical protein VX613_06050 [Candidatus Thermoplasmatota archaeon]|nr:hypothetical protein [Candidatus Thermoplasmatota archaeon]